MGRKTVGRVESSPRAFKGSKTVRNCLIHHLYGSSVLDMVTALRPEGLAVSLLHQTMAHGRSQNRDTPVLTAWSKAKVYYIEEN